MAPDLLLVAKSRLLLQGIIPHIWLPLKLWGFWLIIVETGAGAMFWWTTRKGADVR